MTTAGAATGLCNPGGRAAHTAVRRVPVPRTRDPFVNNHLIAAGRGADGEERFWITTWNSAVGCLGALVSAAGQARIYRFPRRHPGFYSAAAVDNDTLWLCGDLSHVVRLDLRSGRFEAFATGAPGALVFSGMPYDAATGRLLALGHPLDRPGPCAVVFDTRRLAPVNVHRDLPADKYMRWSCANGDGTWSSVLHIPGESFLHWDPAADTLAVQRFNPHLDSESLGGGTTYSLVADARGRRYVPGRGWYDPRTRRFVTGGPRPRQEMTWFAARAEQAWGCSDENGSARLGRWDWSTGAVHPLATVPDMTVQGFSLTAAGAVVAVNLYGEFFRFDGQTGALQLTRRLPADSQGIVDCVCRIGPDRLLGTPFITQRFWEVNLRTGRGTDCGRAAPGAGEVLQTWRLGGKVYMAAYTGAELMEYDPRRPARFPENPRLVADPPGGMRPVAAADDGRRLWYACSRPYGTLGSMLARYDTRTGAALYAADPLPDQQIQSLGYDRTRDRLLCGTTIHADCRSCEPVARHAWFAVLDPDTLAVRRRVAAPAGCPTAVVDGPVGPGRWLCRLAGLPDRYPWFVLDLRTLRLPPVEAMHPVLPGVQHLLYAGRPGRFVLQREGRVELWDWRQAEPVCVRTLCPRFTGYRVLADGASVYLLHPRHITVLDGCLRGP